MPERLARDVEQSLEVHGEGVTQAPGVEVVERFDLTPLERGVVDQHVDATEALDGLAHQTTAVLELRQVDSHAEHVLSGLADPGLGLAGVFLSGTGRVTKATDAPSRAKAMATARPMPLSPPVIRAIRPSRRPWPR